MPVAETGKQRQGRAGLVAGYALSFSPPKSVSLLWALADEAVSAEVRASHDAAVNGAMEFLQDHAAFTRRGHAGAVQADTDGYVAAAFTHRTSRARDPQLHTGPGRQGARGGTGPGHPGTRAPGTGGREVGGGRTHEVFDLCRQGARRRDSGAKRADWSRAP